MPTLYLDRRGLTLRLDGRRAVALYEGERLTHRLPLRLLDRVVVQGDVALSSGLLGRLAEAGVSVVLLTKRNSRRWAVVSQGLAGDARPRLAQYRLQDEPAQRAAWARALVRAKLRRQQRTLQRLPTGREGPAEAERHRSAIRALRRAAARLEGGDEPIERIRGIEGGAAAAYYRALAGLAPARLGFRGRNRRPPKDPLNACLSLAFTLLHADAVEAARTRGLDPFLGFYHRPAYNRESLGTDLIEPLRPEVDEWAVRGFRKRVLDPDHFHRAGEGCYLSKAGRARFYARFERHAPRWRRLLRWEVIRVKRLLLSQGADEAAHPSEAARRASDGSTAAVSGPE